MTSLVALRRLIRDCRKVASDRQTPGSASEVLTDVISTLHAYEQTLSAKKGVDPTSVLANELQCAWSLIDARAVDLEEDGSEAAWPLRHHANRIKATLLQHGGKTPADFE